MKDNRKLFNHTQAVILFIMLTIALHILGLRINGVITGSELISAYLDYGSKILAVILVTEMLLLIWLSPMKIDKEALRFSAKKDGKGLLQSTVIALLIVAALLGFRFYMNTKNPAYREIPLFGLYLNVHTRWLYPVSIVFQEFFIKAFTQENIGIAIRSIGPEGRQDGQEKKQTFLIALITAMFFFVLHIQFPLYYMTGAFLLCFFTGLLYERDRNIWGPVIIHFALGFMPRCFGVLQIIEGS